MASLTKIMTCLVVLKLIEKFHIIPKESKAIVSKSAVLLGGTTAQLMEGDELTVNDLLFGMMLPSGNDAAYCLCEYFGEMLLNFSKIPQIPYSSTSYFIHYMNKLAVNLQLTKTHFTTPHGLSSQLHYSTANELAILSDYALKYSKFFRNIVSTQTHSAVIVRNGEGKELI